MLGHWLASLAIVLIAPPMGVDPDTAELVKQLGASRYADREAGGEALVKIGRAAVRELARAAEGSDPEIRLRAANLITRIDAAELLGPTRLTLDLRDRPLAEAAAAIEATSGLRLRFPVVRGNLRDDNPWPDTRITLDTSGPRPFWEVVDRFCRTSGLQRGFLHHFASFRPPFEMALAPGKGRPPARDTGPFRVELLRVRYFRDRYYGPDDRGDDEGSAFGIKVDKATGVSEFSSYAAELLVSVEPKLRLFGIGAVEQAEAVDERGRSLLKLPAPEEEERRLALWKHNPDLDPRNHPGLRYGTGWRSSSVSMPFPIALSYPTPPAERIARLGGIVPVLAVGRRPDPLVVPLKGAKGKEFVAGKEKIRVHAIQDEQGREPVVEFTLETDRPDNEQTMTAYAADGLALDVNRPIDMLTLRLEVIDGRGEPVFWQFNKTPSGNTQGRMAIVFNGPNGVRLRPDDLRIRCWRLVAVTADLPFEFRDVPTP